MRKYLPPIPDSVNNFGNQPSDAFKNSKFFADVDASEENSVRRLGWARKHSVGGLAIIWWAGNNAAGQRGRKSAPATDRKARPGCAIHNGEDLSRLWNQWITGSADNGSGRADKSNTKRN